MATERLRIFISSPGDVAEERVLANNLVRRLADQFADKLWIEPVFWEHEPLPATMSFPKRIPPPHDCDVVVCILWSRIGTRLPADITRPDGTRYASGTEYEFEDAAEGFRLNGRPDLLVYRKTATPLTDLSDKVSVVRHLEQLEGLNNIWQKWFVNDLDGSFKAAFHNFAGASDFETLLNEHLSKLILRRLPQRDAPSTALKPFWTMGSPFRGLDVFEFEHAPIFFGRTKAIGDLLNALRANALAGRAFVLVVGVSGGGKSSLVRAGVLPVLVQPGVIEGVGLWRRAILKPSDRGGDLLRALTAALLAPEALPELGADGTTIDQLADLFRQSPAAAHLVIRGGLSQAASALAREQSLAAQPEARLVVVVDQLEELFTLPNVTSDDCQVFLAALSSFARSGKVWVIATLRGDFYHRAFEIPELVALQEGTGQYALPVPTAAELAQMIIQPARAAGLRFEEDPESKVPLDEVLRESASASPESLPLLEFALEELCQRKTPEELLTYAAYRELGGVEGALTQRAEAVFESLPEDVQGTLPRVMRGLVRVGEGDSVARQHATLEAVAPTPAAKTFVEAFVQARLVAADRTEQGQAVVRVTHEALLRNWPRLRTWLEQDRELLMVKSRVSAAAARWQAEGRGSDLLLGEGKPLEEAKALALTLGGELPEAERSLIEVSQGRQRRRNLVKQVAVASLIFLTIATGLGGVYSRWEQSRADANAQKAKENETRAEIGEREAKKNAIAAELRLAEGLVSQGDAFELSGRWGDARAAFTEAYAKLGEMRAPRFRAETGLENSFIRASSPLLTFTGHNGRVTSVAISPDGCTCLSVSDDGTLKHWDLVTGKVIRTLSKSASDLGTLKLLTLDGKKNFTVSGHSLESLHRETFGSNFREYVCMRCVAISPDGQTALTGGWTKALTLWDLTTGKEKQTFTDDGVLVNSVVISPDGRIALSGGNYDGYGPVLWDMTTGKALQTFSGHESEVTSLAISPDGKTAISGSGDHTIKLWDLTTGKEVRTFSGHRYSVKSVAFSPDGRAALSGGFDGELKLWDVASGKETRSLSSGYGIAQTSVAFSPHGHTAICGGLDGTITLWDVDSGKQLRTLLGHIGQVSKVVVSGEGRTAISAGFDKTLKSWDLTATKEPRILLGHTAPAASVAMSPDGRTALSGSEDKSVKLWDLGSGKEIRTFSGHSDTVGNVSISPDGHTALSGSYDKTLRLWELGTGKLLRTLSGHTENVARVAISPNGKTAFSASKDKTIRHWDLGTGRESLILRARSVIGPDVDAGCLAISPDCQTIIFGDYDGTLRVCDSNTQKEITRFTGHLSFVTSVIISPDSKFVISSSLDGQQELWDLMNGKEIRPLSAQTSYATDGAISPDGLYECNNSTDNTIRLVELSSGKGFRTLSGHTGRINGVGFNPNGQAVISASADKTVMLWDFSRAALYLEFDRAVPKAQASLQQKPDDPAALQVLGDWYAFRGVNHWAVDLLEKARAGGATVRPLTLAACYWELSDDLPAKSNLTRKGCLEAARREYGRALGEATEEKDKFYLQLCLSAVERASAQPRVEFEFEQGSEMVNWQGTNLPPR